MEPTLGNNTLIISKYLLVGNFTPCHLLIAIYLLMMSKFISLIKFFLSCAPDMCLMDITIVIFRKHWKNLHVIYWKLKTTFSFMLLATLPPLPLNTHSQWHIALLLSTHNLKKYHYHMASCSNKKSGRNFWVIFLSNHWYTFTKASDNCLWNIF